MKYFPPINPIYVYHHTGAKSIPSMDLLYQETQDKFPLHPSIRDLYKVRKLKKKSPLYRVRNPLHSLDYEIRKAISRKQMKVSITLRMISLTVEDCAYQENQKSS